MKSIRNIVAAVAAGSALSFGTAAFAQDTKPSEPAKPQAEEQHRGHQHMGRMRGGCHGGDGTEHKHREHRHSS